MTENAMPTVDDLRDLRDVPRVPEGATPEQAGAWMEEQLGLTQDAANEMIAPYWGDVGRYRQELGTIGEYALWRAAQASVSTAGEEMGYASPSSISERWRDLGLPVARRSANADPFRPPAAICEVSSAMGVDDLRAYLRAATSITEHVHEVAWEIPAGATFARLHLFADLQLGVSTCDYARWEEFVGEVAEDRDCRAVGIGDLLNYGNQGHRTASETEVLPPEAAANVLRADLKRMRRQLAAVYTGNHERRPAKDTGVNWDPIMDVCRDLGVYYGGYDGLVRWKIKSGPLTETYLSYFHHGIGGAGRTAGYPLNKVKQLADGFGGLDFCAAGHVHHPAVGHDGRDVVDAQGRIVLGGTRLISVPSWQRRIAGSYARNKALPPGRLGAMTVRMYLDRHDVTVEEA